MVREEWGVSITPHPRGCVSLPQIPLADQSRLAYGADVFTAQPTKESHMANLTCAFTRGMVWTHRGCDLA